ncbi:MAG TPA: MFS transporter, partial [Micrococcaceae bacterium]
GNRDFLIASAARFTAAVGYGAVVVSILLHIQSNLGDSRHGAWSVTGFLLVATLPMVLLAPWAGRLADTHDSRLLATVASMASALAVAAMAVSMQLFTDYLPALYLLTFVLEAALAVAGPTWQALLPRIVGEERTPRAMGSMQATLMLAQMVGPAAGGILVGQGGTQFSFWMAGACYLLLTAGALSIRTRREHSAENAGRSKPRLLDGLRVLNGDSLLWSLLVGTMFIILAGEAINVLEIFLARETLGANKAQYGLLSAVMALGLVAGSLAAGAIVTENLRLMVFLASVTATSVALILMGLAPTLVMLFVFSAMAGVAIGALNATFGALIMMRTPEGETWPGHGHRDGPYPGGLHWSAGDRRTAGQPVRSAHRLRALRRRDAGRVTGDRRRRAGQQAGAGCPDPTGCSGRRRSRRRRSGRLGRFSRSAAGSRPGPGS